MIMVSIIEEQKKQDLYKDNNTDEELSWPWFITN